MALELVKLDSGTLPSIADAIREKTGDSALLLPAQMAAAIGKINSLHAESGTITPAEDTQTITIPSTGKVLDIVGVSVPAVTGYVIAVSYSKGNYNISAQMGGYFRYASATSIISTGIGVSIQDGNMIVTTGNTARLFAAGATYRWTVYNWEDDA